MSFVNILATDADTIEDPCWEDVEKAILSLDATAVTEVMLAPAPPKGPPDGDQHMGIGGGKNGRYIVYVTEDNLHFWNLEDASKSHEKKPIHMLVGGQQGDYRETQCVPREWALKAAQEYFDHGRRAEGLPWKFG